MQKKVSARSQVIGAMFLLLFFVIIYRFYDIQAVDAAWYQEKAEKMWNRENILKAQRGSIFDRNGETLAKEAAAYTVAAILNKDADNHVENPMETARALAPLLKMPVENLHHLLTQDRYQVELRPGGRKIDRALMEEIRELNLPGIVFIEETKRYYPNNDFASHVLGFINLDGETVMGLEEYLDEQLRGTDGSIQFSKDAKGNRLPQGLQSIVQPEHGKHVYLTLDERIQLYVEQALDEAEAAYQPEKITVVVANPKTGEILAMSSRPSFNPNRYTDGIENYVNHAITSTFEPGSTFKIITLAAAIEEGKFNAEEAYMSGSYNVPGGTIRDHVRGGWGRISFLEGVQKSSNVAFTILGYKRLPKEVFYHYIQDFGFGELTGIDLPNEKKGYLKPAHNIPPIDLANMTFGQGVAVTAIQQVAAVNAIANGGKLLKPYIIKKMVDPETGETILENKPTVINEQVVSKETAKQVSDILETVVTDGTGRNFYIEGYQVAGKTGTAQKVGDNGRYISGKYIHSFIGYAPKDDPQLMVYVAVDAPKVDYTLGGSVVAQIFKPVMLNSLQYLKVHPQVEEVNVEVTVEEGKTLADYTNTSLMAARQKAEAMGLEVMVLGNGAAVTEQVPAPGTQVFAKERIYLLAGEVTETYLPDFTGWSLREVRDWAAIANMDVRTLGTGYAVSQNRDAGQLITRQDQVVVDFKAKYDQSQEVELEDEPASGEEMEEEEGMPAEEQRFE